MNAWINRFLADLREGNKGGYFAHRETVPRRPARYAHLERPLPDGLVRMLEDKGIVRLFCHQAEAINLLSEGRNVIVSTSTASGKSLCYHIPALSALLSDRKARALYVFPTKALAHDQLDSLGSLVPWESSIVCNTYDGDTPREDRRNIRRNSSIVITNPDMLHIGVLPYHRGWADFLSNLRLVVIDEAHYYRGVLGAHVAMIARRLRRICRSLGSSPQFVLCSATLTNATEHAENMVGLPFVSVEDDGSPSGGREFVFWNPTSSKEDEQARASINIEAAEITARLVGQNIKTMTFVRSRAGVERVCDFTRRMLPGRSRDTVHPYRAGYLPDYRRETERRLHSGEILGLVTTNAMELGVDVGSLDATVITGYPGTVSSVWQQAGRSGRAQTPALSVLVARDHPVDQYYMQNPGVFFDSPYESARITTSNPRVLEDHLKCAAFELPLSREDFDLFGEDDVVAVTRTLSEDGQLLRGADSTWMLAQDSTNPAFDVSIRSIDSQMWKIADVSSGEVVERVDGRMAFFDLYPGAIYMHKGLRYAVESLDRDSLIATVRLFDECGYYTSLDVDTDIKIVRTMATRPAGGNQVSLGIVEVSSKPMQFARKSLYGDEVISTQELSLSPRVFETTALWYGVPRTGRRSTDALLGAFAALEYTGVNALAMFAMCDPSDILGASFVRHRDTEAAQVFLLDNHPGGVGIAELGYDIVERLWARMREIDAEHAVGRYALDREWPGYAHLAVVGVGMIVEVLVLGLRSDRSVNFELARAADRPPLFVQRSRCSRPSAFSLARDLPLFPRLAESFV